MGEGYRATRLDGRPRRDDPERRDAGPAGRLVRELHPSRSMSLPLGVCVLFFSTAIVWVASARLDDTAQRLARHYHLPPSVQGALIAAIGSSFPELATTVVSTWAHDAFDLGIAAIVGSAVFNILVIPALAGLASGAPLRFDLKLLYRDAQFYLTSIALLLLTFSFALIHHPQGEALVGRLTRPLALLPLVFYGLYLFLHHQEASEQRGRPAEEPAIRPGRQWLELAGSMLGIVVGVEGLVRMALALGESLGVASFFWGATMIAAATSIPDAILSVRAARRGDPEVSLTNVLGSNIFDLLVAVPAGVLVAGAANVDFAVATPMMGFLTLATLWIFTAMRMGLRIGRGECWSFLALYLVFVAWVGLEGAGWLGFTRFG